MSLRMTLLAAAACFGVLANLPSYAADGAIDPGFGADGVAILALDDIEGRELRTRAALVQPDGKLLFGGSRNKFVPTAPFDPHVRGTLMRLNADGSPDADFIDAAGIAGLVVLPDLVPGDQMQTVEDIRLLADGSILATGSAEAFGPLAGFVVKLDADGVLDPAFGNEGVVILPSTYLHALAVDSHGRIVAAGERVSSGHYGSLVVRLNADGSADSSFGPAADGSALIEWSPAGEAGYLTSLALAPDDGVLVAGQYEVYGQGMGGDFAIARLDADGLPDADFADAGRRVFHIPDHPSTLNGISKLLLQPDGSAVFAGYYDAGESSLHLVLGRIDAGGDSDPAFGAATTPGFQTIPLVPDAWNRYASGLVRQRDGKLLVGVTYATPVGRENYLALRVSSTGQLDADFADGGVFETDLAPDGVYSDLSALTLLPDGRPILAGAVMRDTGSPLVDLAVLRLSNDSADRVFADGFD
jgi:uncharacterized delta-60 repeat protein